MQFVFFFILFFSTTGYAVSECFPKYECSALMNIESQKWVTDSLGTKGYRERNFKMLRDCKLKEVSKTFLIEKLGRPNRVVKLYSGVTGKNIVEYMYFIQSIYPDGEKRPFEGRFISFILDENEINIEQITDGNICG
jgi:hypothetical protein